MGNYLLLALCLLPFCFFGCAVAPPPVKPQAPSLAKIHRVGVLPVEGEGGADAFHELVRQLLGAGFEVTEPTKKPDAWVSARMTEYKTANKQIVFLGEHRSVEAATNAPVVTNPVVSGMGTVVDGSTLGKPKSQMVLVNAVTGMQIRLMDPASKSVLWVQEFSYEGVDVASALEAMTHVLVHALQRSQGKP